MKKIIVIQFILFGITLSQSQSTIKAQYGQKYQKKEKSKPLVSSTPKTPAVNSRSKPSIKIETSYIKIDADARSFADKIASASKKFIFLQEKQGYEKNTRIFRYVPSVASDKTKYSTRNTCKECMDIEFKLKNSKDKTYVFSHVWGSFSDLFPVWKSLFYPDARSSDYEISTQNIKAEWKTYYEGNEVVFGQLGGESWYIIMK